MSSKKSFLADDPPLNRNFNASCPYVLPKKSDLRCIDAPVRCTIEEKGSKCKHCGWYPEEKRRRLVAMVGEKQADELMEQSEKLTLIMLQEIAKGRYGYV